MLWWIILGIIVSFGVLVAFIAAPGKADGGSFDSFVRKPDPSKVIIRVKKPDPYKRVFLSPGKQILILIGTEYGFGEVLPLPLPFEFPLCT